MLRVSDQAAVTDTGLQRAANEDAYLARPPLFVVADGMGGAQAGEVASRIATSSFELELNQSVSPERRLEAVVLDANREIYDLSVSDRRYNGMGTTLTALLVGDDDVTVAHVGDSRAYRFRDDELVRITHDHSLVAEMVKSGAISEAEAEVHPQRSIITRALGPEKNIKVDLNTHSARRGDVYMLCSDGLTAMVDETEIAQIVRRSPSMKALASELVRTANAHGGADNITVVAFALTELDLGGRTDVDEQHTSVIPVQATPPLRSANKSPTKSSLPQAATPATPAAGSAVPRTAPTQVPPAVLDRRRQGRRLRTLLGVFFALFVLAVSFAGALVATKQVYFLGVDEHGLVTMYRGTPYELPLGLTLYQESYVSTKRADELAADQRTRLLGHQLRSRDDAVDLVRRLELNSLRPVPSN